ncbi:hypothetical protein [Marivita sp.]|uniref:hypothetical protein n=1 Tax=Marivita sp. TaxID=2003365 RepID=UPI003F6AC011
MNRVLSALPLDIYFAGAAQQKYQESLKFVSIFRIELLPCGAKGNAGAEKNGECI